jgi:hypothetical protein
MKWIKPERTWPRASGSDGGDAAHSAAVPAHKRASRPGSNGPEETGPMTKRAVMCVNSVSCMLKRVRLYGVYIFCMHLLGHSPPPYTRNAALEAESEDTRSGPLRIGQLRSKQHLVPGYLSPAGREKPRKPSAQRRFGTLAPVHEEFSLSLRECESCATCGKASPASAPKVITFLIAREQVRVNKKKRNSPFSHFSSLPSPSTSPLYSIPPCQLGA